MFTLREKKVCRRLLSERKKVCRCLLCERKRFV